MSFRFRTNGGLLPVSLSDGYIRVHLGTKYIIQDYHQCFEQFKNIQCLKHSYPTSGIQAFLSSNDMDEDIILRFDGTVTFYRKSDRAVTKNFKINLPNLSKVLFRYTGTIADFAIAPSYSSWGGMTPEKDHPHSIFISIQRFDGTQVAIVDTDYNGSVYVTDDPDEVELLKSYTFNKDFKLNVAKRTDSSYYDMSLSYHFMKGEYIMPPPNLNKEVLFQC